MPHATDIVAYVFQAEILCPHCTAKAVAPLMTPSSLQSPHDIIREVGLAHGVNVDDEHTFDSDDFPKVVFRSQIEEPEHCGTCHEEIE